MSFLDYSIVCLYFLVILIAGVFKGRQNKNLVDYAIGRRGFSNMSITITMFVTTFGAFALNGMIGLTYEHGFKIFCFWEIPWIVNLCLLVLIFNKNIHKFYGMLSFCEIIHSLYGNTPRLISAVVYVITGCCLLSLQIFGLGIIIEYFFNISKMSSILLGGGLTVLYASNGGMKGIMFTDMLQLLLIFITLPLLFNMLVNVCGGYQAVYQSIPYSHKAVDIFDRNNLSLVLSGIAQIIPWCPPCIVQMMLMTNSTRQVKTVGLSFVGISVIVSMLVVAMGLSFVVFEQMFHTNVGINFLLNYFIDNYVPIFFKGIAVSGLLAVIMSTADTFLNVISVVVMNDLVIPIFKIDTTKTLSVTKGVSFLIGSISIFFAFFINDFYYLKILVYNLADVVYGVPLLLGMVGFRTSKISFYSSCVFGGLTAFLLRFFAFKNQMMVLSPSVLASFIGFFGSHYFLLFFTNHFKNKNVGFLKKRNNNEVVEIDEYKWLLYSIKRKKIFMQIKQFLYDVRCFSIKRFLKDDILNFGTEDKLFSIFILIVIIFPLFMSATSDKYTVISQIIKYFIAVIAYFILIKDKMPIWYQDNWAIIWHASLILILPFSGFILLSINGGTLYWHLSMLICFLMLNILTSRRMFVINSLLGLILGKLVLYILNIKVIFWGQDIVKHSIEFKYLYTFTAFIIILFGKRKKIREAERMEAYIKSAGVVSHELSSPIGILSCSLEKLEKLLQKKQLLSTDFISLKGTIEVSRQMIKNMSSFMTIFLQNVKNIDDLSNFKLKEIDIVDTVKGVIDNYPFNDYERGIINIESAASRFKIIGNDLLMAQSVLNVLRNSLFFVAGVKNPLISIKFYAPESGDYNLMIIKDNGIGMSNYIRGNLFAKFYTQRDSGYGLGLFFCKNAMRRMNGFIDCTSVVGEYTEIFFKFPKI